MQEKPQLFQFVPNEKQVPYGQTTWYSQICIYCDIFIILFLSDFCSHRSRQHTNFSRLFHIAMGAGGLKEFLFSAHKI
jgi:hypothetical protein